MKHASVAPSKLSTRAVSAEFQRLLKEGAKFLPAGEAKEQPRLLLNATYLPRYKIELFDTRFYICRAMQNPALRFVVAYVVQGQGRRAKIYPRIFYKDLSLIWRVASHLISEEGEFWIGKGAVQSSVRNGYEYLDSVECTTDLPLEMQHALEIINRQSKKVPENAEALYLVLRRAPKGRITPYRDFSLPRKRAQATPQNLLYGNKKIARFTRKNDPRSLRIVKGYEPDFSKGQLERSAFKSAMYGGKMQRYRFVSRNKKIQWSFITGPHHAWVIPPQALTTELSSYGVRCIDVHADEDLFVPGYEYHYTDPDDPSESFSQIPPGFAGKPSEHDPDRADTSKWLEALPLIKEFRHKVL